MLKAINIEWDTEWNMEALESLPTEIEIPEGMFDKEEISDYISEETGFTHYGFELFDTYYDITAESVEEKLYNFFNDKMETGETTVIEWVGVFKDNLVTRDSGIIIDCVGGKQIRLTIQVS